VHTGCDSNVLTFVLAHVRCFAAFFKHADPGLVAGQAVVAQTVDPDHVSFAIVILNDDLHEKT